MLSMFFCVGVFYVDVFLRRNFFLSFWFDQFICHRGWLRFQSRDKINSIRFHERGRRMLKPMTSYQGFKAEEM
jgi:hypothetical protein